MSEILCSARTIANYAYLLLVMSFTLFTFPPVVMEAQLIRYIRKGIL